MLTASDGFERTHRQAHTASGAPGGVNPCLFRQSQCTHRARRYAGAATIASLCVYFYQHKTSCPVTYASEILVFFRTYFRLVIKV